MTQQIIDTGSVANDGTGDPIRAAFTKTNANFDELYNTATVNVTGNITGGNLTTTGTVTGSTVNTAGLVITGVEIVAPNYVAVSGSGTTTLSAVTSNNILVVGNTGYTLTVDLPVTPGAGQITRFSISGNTVTLVVGTGTITPTFAGSRVAGTAFTYVYRSSNSTWYRLV